MIIMIEARATGALEMIPNSRLSVPIIEEIQLERELTRTEQ